MISLDSETNQNQLSLIVKDTKIFLVGSKAYKQQKLRIFIVSDVGVVIEDWIRRVVKFKVWANLIKKKIVGNCMSQKVSHC